MYSPEYILKKLGYLAVSYGDNQGFQHYCGDLRWVLGVELV